MLFNSLTYLSFLLIVVMMFWNFSYRAKFYLIFLKILIFYGFWKIEFIFLLLFSTTLDWWIGIKIHESKIRNKKIFNFKFNL